MSNSDFLPPRIILRKLSFMSILHLDFKLRKSLFNTTSNFL
uniref:Uncharacterized protein n=1 Tax=Rhizophora mucronata TaxID=61149 RepID=A0A2P2QQ48_RHIMU